MIIIIMKIAIIILKTSRILYVYSYRQLLKSNIKIKEILLFY